MNGKRKKKKTALGLPALSGLRAKVTGGRKARGRGGGMKRRGRRKQTGSAGIAGAH